MKQLGNLAIVCAGRAETLLQIYHGKAYVHIGEGPEREHLVAKWDDDEAIKNIVRELNFGKYATERNA